MSTVTQPAGRVDTRLVRNLKPGQWIWPLEWAGDEPDRQWALVLGNPVTYTLRRDLGKLCAVQCMWPDGNPLELQERPNSTGRVIIPAPAYLAKVQHEVTLLSGDHPRLPGLGMSSVEALPERGPEVAVMAAERALEDDLVTGEQTDLIVEDSNPVTGVRRYRIVPSESRDFFTAELIEGVAP